MSNLPKFSRALLHPRYWLLWLGIGFLWLLVQLPYPGDLPSGNGAWAAGNAGDEKPRADCQT